MQNSDNGSTDISETILNDNELLSLVIEKHKRFNEEYSTELEDLKQKVEDKRSDYQHISKALETIETRVVVLQEKRHQLYHRARKLRIQLLETLIDHTKNLHYEKEMEKIENRLQNANLSFTEEIRNVDQIYSLLNEMVLEISINDIQQRVFSSIIDILDTAKTARQELKDMEDSPHKLKNDSKLLKKEFEEMEVRMDWLGRRLHLHKAALEHWENVKAEVDQRE